MQIMQVIKQLGDCTTNVEDYNCNKYDNGNVGLIVRNYLKGFIYIGDIFHYTFTHEKRGFYNYNNVNCDIRPQATEIKNIQLKIEKIIWWNKESDFLIPGHNGLIYFSGTGFEHIENRSILSNVYPINNPF